MAQLSVLIIGGSGFVSGTLTRSALSQAHQVWTLTRGQRPVPDGAVSLVADRHDTDSFQKAVAEAETTWDLVVDCIGYGPADARQDLAVFRDRASHLIFISTDFVFDPSHRRFPQPEESDHYLSEGYGGNKRLCELELISGNAGNMHWTILRPCHIYGPGSLLGCLPMHGRDADLIRRLRRGEPLRLVGGGHFLQQPIFARDLAELVLSAAGNDRAYCRIFCAAGPDVIESREYYRLIADSLGVRLTVQEMPVDEYLGQHPEAAPFLCHRIYDLSKLRSSGLKVPATPIGEGLREHVEGLLSEA